MNVGDYVRTNDGYINKIKKVNQWNVLVDARDLFGEEINIANNEIIKSSPNIIDLIEVKDIITFQCISDDYDFKYKEQYTNQINNNDELESFKEAVENEDLKLISIVTKEQFESIKYKVGE